ncbi:metallophosphoesterase [Vibrio splendidus]
MKILHLSDLHLEFGPMDVPTTDADIVVLSGDIHAGSRGIDWASEFKIPVIYVLGNHEFYGFTQFDELIQECRNKARRYPNIHFLENESVLIDGVRFHGATFWTDFELENNATLSMHYARTTINDYRKITYKDQYFTPEIAAGLHAASRKWLFNSVRESAEERNVIVTHYLPTPEAIQPKFKGSPLNPAFASDCNEFSELTEKISIWLYGHNHDSNDFVSNGIRYSTNQRGYDGVELVGGFDPRNVIEINISLD